MVAPTPWQASARRTVDPGPAPVSSGPTAPLRPRLAADSFQRAATSLRRSLDAPAWEKVIRRDWSRWCAALAAFIMMYTLFKPWLVGKSMDGEVHVNAFGRVQVDTTLVGLWSRHPPKFGVATGQWPILAICAGIITIAAVLINYRFRSERLILIATASTVLGAVFIVATLIYINSRGEALRGIVGQGDALDVGSQIGYVIRAMAGNRAYPVPGLRTTQRFSSTFTGWAYFGAALSIVSAVGISTQWFGERATAKAAAAPSDEDMASDDGTTEDAVTHEQDAGNTVTEPAAAQASPAGTGAGHAESSASEANDAAREVSDTGDEHGGPDPT